MSDNGSEKEPHPVEPFTVPVLGGVFHVSSVLLEGRDSHEDAVALIHAIPADRWFVMVSEQADSAEDALAMIDDQLEFQICARGVLRQD